MTVKNWRLSPGRMNFSFIRSSDIDILNFNELFNNMQNGIRHLIYSDISACSYYLSAITSTINQLITMNNRRFWLVLPRAGSKFYQVPSFFWEEEEEEGGGWTRRFLIVATWSDLQEMGD